MSDAAASRPVTLAWTPDGFHAQIAGIGGPISMGLGFTLVLVVFGGMVTLMFLLMIVQVLAGATIAMPSALVPTAVMPLLLRSVARANTFAYRLNLSAHRLSLWDGLRWHRVPLKGITRVWLSERTLTLTIMTERGRTLVCTAHEEVPVGQLRWLAAQVDLAATSAHAAAASAEAEAAAARAALAPLRRRHRDGQAR
jgi:hypothetical protein